MLGSVLPKGLSEMTTLEQLLQRLHEQAGQLLRPACPA